ncbi:hypothetical protein [Streptomyces sp. NBC_00105]|uniref:hypothetical protein n=1 Tax=Streptomyces sp. NBC_00105 TaxID=2903622 RepID=UPI0028889FA6|nr:hypothetical protein [Streptomyces sp. DSM 41633]
MLVRPARRHRPAVAAFLAGVVLACAYLMWGPGHASAMSMPAPMPGMAAMAAVDSTADAGQHPAVSGAGHDGCPAMSMDCPLATAHPPLPVALVAPPAPTALAQPAVADTESARTTDDGCAWPRAPDPVALLCVSRT